MAKHHWRRCCTGRQVAVSRVDTARDVVSKLGNVQLATRGRHGPRRVVMAGRLTREQRVFWQRRRCAGRAQSTARGAWPVSVAVEAVASADLSQAAVWRARRRGTTRHDAADTLCAELLTQSERWQLGRRDDVGRVHGESRVTVFAIATSGLVGRLAV